MQTKMPKKVTHITLLKVKANEFVLASKYKLHFMNKMHAKKILRSC